MFLGISTASSPVYVATYGRILILQKGEEGEVRDEIRYWNHRINQVLPAEIIGFHLPSDVSVEELKW